VEGWGEGWLGGGERTKENGKEKEKDEELKGKRKTSRTRRRKGKGKGTGRNQVCAGEQGGACTLEPQNKKDRRRH